MQNCPPLRRSRNWCADLFHPTVATKPQLVHFYNAPQARGADRLLTGPAPARQGWRPLRGLPAPFRPRSPSRTGLAAPSAQPLVAVIEEARAVAVALPIRRVDLKRPHAGTMLDRRRRAIIAHYFIPRLGAIHDPHHHRTGTAWPPLALEVIDRCAGRPRGNVQFRSGRCSR
jgi:hypothetical protein